MDGAIVGAQIAEAAFVAALEVASTLTLEYVSRRGRRNSPAFEQRLLY
jgi:hypothetical protein